MTNHMTNHTSGLFRGVLNNPGVWLVEHIEPLAYPPGRPDTQPLAPGWLSTIDRALKAPAASR